MGGFITITNYLGCLHDIITSIVGGFGSLAHKHLLVDT